MGWKSSGAGRLTPGLACQVAKEGGGEVEEGARKVQTRAEAMEKKKKEKLKREREVGRGGADRRVKGGVRKVLTMIPPPYPPFPTAEESSSKEAAGARGSAGDGEGSEGGEGGGR